MKLISKIKSENQWHKVKDKVLNLRNEIAQEHINEIIQEFGTFSDIDGLKPIDREIEKIRREASFNSIS